MSPNIDWGARRQLLLEQAKALDDRLHEVQHPVCGRCGNRSPYGAHLCCVTCGTPQPNPVMALDKIARLRQALGAFLLEE